MKQITQLNHTFSKPLRRRIRTTDIILHHTASHDVSATEIHRWHVQRGWIGIGYHFIIRRNGSIEIGRPENMVGAHAGPGMNSRSIGIGLTGNFMREDPSSAQIDSLIWLIRDLETRFGKLEFKGHRDVMATACPGVRFPMDDVRRRLMTSTEQKYTVKSGDTLWSIASAQLGNGTRFNEIARLNNLTSQILRPGQELILP